MADVLPDGTRVLVRPLLPGDRDELAAGYGHLSPESRHLRFFLPPEALTEEDLDRLTDLDYRDRFAWVAFALDDPGRPGVAVARYSRDPARPDTAEVAVTVADAYQHRGLGTLLTYRLADVALGNGIRRFVSYVLWEHAHLLDVLRKRGARVVADEPGIARVEFDLPLPAGGAPSGALVDRALVGAGLAPHVVEERRDLGGEAAGPEAQLEQ
jgi:RimJ/RimL family protein N-acetyltransferase